MGSYSRRAKTSIPQDEDNLYVRRGIYRLVSKAYGKATVVDLNDQCTSTMPVALFDARFEKMHEKYFGIGTAIELAQLGYKIRRECFIEGVYVYYSEDVGKILVSRGDTIGDWVPDQVNLMAEDYYVVIEQEVQA
jgi:hypothetical protein